MHDGYPRIEHIDDLLPALKGREDLEKAFLTFERDRYVSVDYILMIPGIFGCLLHEDPHTTLLRREARGIKFCRDTGRILARPHPKIFNVGQEPETQLEALPWREPYRVLEKLDGSIVHAMPIDGEIMFATKKGEVNGRAPLAFAQAHPVDYLGFCRAMLADGFTPIFEWCTPAVRIVLRYAEPKLVLTGIRHTVLGDFVPYEEMAREAGRWGVPVVQELDRDVLDPDAYFDELRARTGIEGVIVRWDRQGYSVKAKTDDYRRQHQFLEDINREDKALEMIFARGEDDVIPALDAGDAEALRRYAGLVNDAVADKAAWAERIAAEHAQDRKTFAVEVAPGLSKLDKALAFAVMKRGEPQKQVLGLLVEPQNGTLKSLEEARAYLGLPSWSDVRDGKA